MEFNLIHDKKKRDNTFTQLRGDLFKKIHELHDLCGGEAAVITFSDDGDLFGCGRPAVNHVFSRYLADPTSTLAKGKGECVLGFETKWMAEMEKRISEVILEIGRPVWDVTVANLGLTELDELEAAMEKIKREVAARGRELRLLCGISRRRSEPGPSEIILIDDE